MEEVEAAELAKGATLALAALAVQAVQVELAETESQSFGFTNNMLSLLILDPNPSDAPGFLRSSDPFCRLRKDFPNSYRLMYGKDVVGNEHAWQAILQADVVFMHRPVGPAALQTAETVKTLGRKLWVDFDDDLLNVPTDHPNYFHFNDPVTVETQKKILGLADIVTVHQETLAEVLRPYCKRLKVIPHAVPDEFLEWRQEPQLPRRKLISWRGSNTHDRALRAFEPEIVKVAKANPDWEWLFVGYIPWHIVEKMEGVKCHLVPRWLTPVEYYQTIHAEQPAIQIVMHEDIPFSKARGNEAWLEASFAGASILAPDFPTWQEPGVFRYGSKKEFRTKLQNLVNHYDQHPHSLTANVKTAWTYIKKNCLTSQVNKLRVQTLKELTEAPKERR